ncbi:MAG: hypothetical protein ABSB75_07605 [Candidatus Limnocylindrales bacterium]
MRRIWVTLLLALAVVGCGSSTATSGAAGGNGGGGGNPTATVIMSGQTYHLSGGTCTDVGVLGTEVAVGDYHNGEAGSGDYLDMMVKGNTVSTVAGRAGGVPWALATGKQSGSIGADMTGTFSGTDFASGTHVEGTFACH